MTSARQPGGTLTCIENASPSIRQEDDTMPCGVSCEARAQVIPPPGNGSTRNVRQVGDCDGALRHSGAGSR
jgi:hypothetical protein